MSGQSDAKSDFKLSKEEARLVIKAIEDVERDEAAEQERRRSNPVSEQGGS